MPIYMPPKSAEFEPPPAGAYVAACYRVIDLGTQDSNYQGKPKKSHMIMIGWELVDELMNDGRPFTISKRYTLSSHKKSRLRGDLESWRGKAFEDSEFGTFDIGKLIGAGCMLNIVHEEKGENLYANVATIMRLPKGTKSPEPKNDRFYFSLNDFNQYDFDKLTDRLKEVITKAPEYKKAIGEYVDETPPPNGDGCGVDLNDEIPF